MIERHIPFTVEEGNAAEFEAFFADRYRPAAEQMPGLVAIALLCSTSDPTAYTMPFRWEDPADAATWRTHPTHEILQPELRSLSSMGEIRVNEVISAGP
jgi:heme-degrading monooxygenase HmoA